MQMDIVDQISMASLSVAPESSFLLDSIGSLGFASFSENFCSRFSRAILFSMEGGTQVPSEEFDLGPRNPIVGCESLEGKIEKKF